jgi:gliding motility-associated-like protein
VKSWEKYIRRILLTSGFCIVYVVGLWGQCVTAVVYSTDITCSKDNDGIIIISNEKGGSGINEYSIDGGKTWQRYNTFTGLAPGIYDIKIRDILTPACVVTLDPARSISEPDPFESGEINTDPVKACVNYKPGEITFTTLPIGGREPYSYQWYLNGNIITGETGNSFEPTRLITPGVYSYYCRVTDGCRMSGITASKTFTVVEGVGIKISGAGNYCQNTAVTLSAEVTGVSGIISYQWQTSTDNHSWIEIYGETSASFSPSTTIPGEIYYRVNIFSEGTVCNNDALLVLDPLPFAEISGTGSVCQDAPPPLITLTGTNGTAPYSIIYNINGENSQTITTLNGNSAVIKAPTETSQTLRYNLTRVSDANGCFQDLNRTFSLEIYSLPTATITAITNVNCYGDSTGTAIATASGGILPYTFQWDTKPFKTTSTATGLQAGIYTVSVTDANGCQDSEQDTVSQPASGLIARITAKEDVPCPGDFTGKAIVSIAGGTQPYRYSWDTYPLQSNETAVGLGMGKYNATVTDFNSCSIIVSVAIEPIHEFCLLVPEAFSPNGDGINDVWYINDVAYYPDIVITIYNRWNQMVWRSERGYPEPWDGRSNNINLPVDSYHYIIEPGGGAKPIIGCVTVVR